MNEKTPTPTIDSDQIVAPDPSEPQESVGGEGGAAPIGTPRRVESDAAKDPSRRRGQHESEE